MGLCCSCCFESCKAARNIVENTARSNLGLGNRRPGFSVIAGEAGDAVSATNHGCVSDSSNVFISANSRSSELEPDGAAGVSWAKSAHCVGSGDVAAKAADPPACGKLEATPKVREARLGNEGASAERGGPSCVSQGEGPPKRSQAGYFSKSYGQKQ